MSHSRATIHSTFGNVCCFKNGQISPHFTNPIQTSNGQNSLLHLQLLCLLFLVQKTYWPFKTICQQQSQKHSIITVYFLLHQYQQQSCWYFFKISQTIFLATSVLWNKNKFFFVNSKHIGYPHTTCWLPTNLYTGLHSPVSPQLLHIFSPVLYFSHFNDFSQFLRVNKLLYKHIYKSTVDFQAIQFIIQTWIKLVQKFEWPDTVQSLSSNQPCPRNPSLLSLNPFINKGLYWEPAEGSVSQINFNLMKIPNFITISFFIYNFTSWPSAQSTWPPKCRLAFFSPCKKKILDSKRKTCH